MGHADGLCAVYVDGAADVRKAVDIVVDAKAQYPAVCNAAETLLVDRKGVEKLLPAVGRALVAEGVTMRVDAEAMRVLDEAGVLRKLWERAILTRSFWILGLRCGLWTVSTAQWRILTGMEVDIRMLSLRRIRKRRGAS